MAHIDDAPRGRARRGPAAALNLVPYIDLLVTLMAFLMISATWTTFSALTARGDGGAGAQSGASVEAPPPHTIHVGAHETRGLDALEQLARRTPIVVEVEDEVHHARVIEVLDTLAAAQRGPATVRAAIRP